MVQQPTTPPHARGCEPATDANFTAYATQIRPYEAGTSQPTLDVLHALALALTISADSLLFDDERDPKNPTLRLKAESVDHFTPDEHEHVTWLIENALLRDHARQAFGRQAI